ncbi:GPDA [Hepatospora eriocheir]|nr:GPDA [Hepatospora eriocheir]
MSIAFGIVEGMIELKELEAHKDKPFKQIGKNTLALIFQKCVEEMYKFSKFMTGTDDCLLMLKSCGVGDLFVSCVSGRNYMSGKHITAFFYENLNKEETLFEYLEKVFKSHKLQGLETVKTLTHVLVERKQIDEFPIIKAVYEICFENANPLSLISLIKEE